MLQAAIRRLSRIGVDVTDAGWTYPVSCSGRDGQSRLRTLTRGSSSVFGARVKSSEAIRIMKSAPKPSVFRTSEELESDLGSSGDRMPETENAVLICDVCVPQQPVQ